jgi:hypothetical protein
MIATARNTISVPPLLDIGEDLKGVMPNKFLGEYTDPEASEVAKVLVEYIGKMKIQV